MVAAGQVGVVSGFTLGPPKRLLVNAEDCPVDVAWLGPAGYSLAHELVAKVPPGRERFCPTEVAWVEIVGLSLDHELGNEGSPGNAKD